MVNGFAHINMFDGFWERYECFENKHCDPLYILNNVVCY